MARLPTICQTRPLWFHRKSLRRRRQARRQGSRTNQHANCNGCRALCFLQRNHRSPHPPRRRGRTKLRGNPRRPLRCDCALLFPKRRRREFFHAEIGQRSYARSVRGRHRAYLCCRLAILSAASKSAPATQQPNDCGARLIAGRRDHGRKVTAKETAADRTAISPSVVSCPHDPNPTNALGSRASSPPARARFPPASRWCRDRPTIVDPAMLALRRASPTAVVLGERLIGPRGEGCFKQPRASAH